MQGGAGSSPDGIIFLNFLNTRKNKMRNDTLGLLLSTQMEIQSIINKTVFNDLGLDLNQFPVENWYQDKGTYSISPSMCGPVGKMFKTLKVTVSTAFQGGEDREKSIWIRYDYKYIHPGGGNNGYQVETKIDFK